LPGRFVGHDDLCESATVAQDQEADRRQLPSPVDPAFDAGWMPRFAEQVRTERALHHATS
jgi:hypothetical protein